MNPSCRARNADSSLGDIEANRRPPTEISPRSGAVQRAQELSSVLLPAPEAPVIARIVPRRTSRSRPSST